MGDDNIRQMASDAIDLLEEAMNRNEMMTIKIKMVAIVKEMIIEVLGMVVGYRLEGMMRIKTEMVIIVEGTIVEVMIMVEWVWRRWRGYDGGGEVHGGDPSKLN